MKTIEFFLGLPKLIRIVSFQILFLLPFPIFAQPSFTVSIPSVIVIAPYSSQLSAYVNNPSKVVISVQKAVGSPDINIKLFATLIGDNGVQITTTQAALPGLNQISLTAAQSVQVVNALYIRNLFELNNVNIQGTTATDLQVSGLPAGNYQLCIQAVTADPDPFSGAPAGAPASDQICGNSFTVNPPSADISILNVVLIPPYSNRISDFLTNPSKVVITVHNGSTYPQFKIKLLASLRGDNGVLISTNPANLNLVPEITLQSGQPTVVLNATSVQNLFNLEGVSLQGITFNELVNGKGLPEGSYDLCIIPVAAEADPATQQQAGQPLSEEKCSISFAVNNLEPPVIINPFTGIDLIVRVPQNILFNWSIPAGVKGGFNMISKWWKFRTLSKM